MMRPFYVRVTNILPDETLLEAFSFLSHYGLNIAVIVCRNWKRAIYLLDDEERNTGREDSDDDVNPFFLGYPRSQKKRRRVQKAPRPVLYYMRVVDGTVNITKQLPPHHDLEHQLTLASIDVNDVRFSDYNFRELRISCNSIMEGQLLGRLLQKFPSLRTVREIDVEYPYSNRNLSIMFRRLKALTHLRRLCITPRDPTRGFILSSRMDEDALLGLCLRRGQYVPPNCTREVDVQYFVSRRFLLRLIEAFKTVAGRNTIDVLHMPQPTSLEQWLRIRRKHFLYSGSDVVKSTLTIQGKKRAHASAWYKCTESNISFLHHGCQFLLSNNVKKTELRIRDLISRSLNAGFV